MNPQPMELGHKPVLLEEALEALQLRADGVYVDGTFGRGGHSAAILAKLGPRGRLLAMDRDPEAEAVARQRFAGDDRFEFVRESFAGMAGVLEGRELMGRVQGILLDLGVSSPQLDEASRGFSFMQDGPLDMRMDPTQGQSAADWLATADEQDISAVLRDLGEERFARCIARHLVASRQVAPIRRTLQLAELITEAMPRHEHHKHPATRCFQAIRLYVNQELEALELCLSQVPNMLAPGGRLAVISFHSLEDRIVKRFIRRQSQGEPLPRGLPVKGLPEGRSLRSLGKAIRPAATEVEANPRCRSALLRAAERLS